MSWWSGYRRFVREGGASRAIFVPRVRCGRCRMTDAVLPAFVLSGRLDVVETIGAVIEEVAVGAGGVRPAATARDVPVELGGEVVGAIGGGVGQASAAIGSAFEVAATLAGWAVLGRWRFASAVSGGGLLATNTNTPYLIVGSRRFMPPVP